MSPLFEVEKEGGREGGGERGECAPSCRLLYFVALCKASPFFLSSFFFFFAYLHMKNPAHQFTTAQEKPNPCLNNDRISAGVIAVEQASCSRHSVAAPECRLISLRQTRRSLRQIGNAARERDCLVFCSPSFIAPLSLRRVKWRKWRSLFAK